MYSPCIHLNSRPTELKVTGALQMGGEKRRTTNNKRKKREKKRKITITKKRKPGM